MELPEILKPFQQEAQKYLSEGLVREIEFSSGTYQVLINENNRDIWTFLQLDKHGSLKDYFCEDEEAEDENLPCRHICAAYLRIYNGHEAPLHQRFEKSLWNVLGRLYVESLGDDPSLLKHHRQGQYSYQTITGKLIFEVEAKDEKAAFQLKEIFEHRQDDTEETSIKFSNLSQEELKLWRQGTPSPHLRYELSYWCDLARLLMLKQEANETYEISFEYSKQGIPNLISINFETLSLRFYLSAANLPCIIPTLATVNSPLKVYDAPEEEIKRIIYDKKEGCLRVEASSPFENIELQIVKNRKKTGISIGAWTFVSSDGFYAQDPHWLLAKKSFCGADLSKAILEHSNLIGDLLEGTTLHEESVKVSYAISFDSHWNLHITCYIFSQGDLSSQDSRFFGGCAYIDDDGIYKLEGVLFPDVETTVPPDALSEFISKNKAWLNTFEGFHVHPTSIEACLLYDVDSTGRLTFSGQLDDRKSLEDKHDFGQWIYIAGQGFYSKESSYAGSQVRAGVSVSAAQVPIFIKVNRDELSFVPNFFSKRSPIQKALLNIELMEKDRISITPYYALKEAYSLENVIIYDDFTYTYNEGFSEFPPEGWLPERYCHAMTIDSDNIEFFITEELPNLEPFIHIIDNCLLWPSEINLIATEIHKQTELSSPEYILKLKYQTNIGFLFVTDIWKAIKKKKKFLFSAAGLLDLQDRRFDWLRWLNKAQVDAKNHIIRLSTIELMRLNALEEIAVNAQKLEEKNRAISYLKILSDLKPPEDPVLTGLSSELRPYQKIGVQWLWFLYHNGLSGLLCDDMGLGKTHQAMALTAAIYNAKDQTAIRKSHVLVVCPTSVIYHWQEKLAAYLPDLKVHVFYGSDRSLEGFKQDYDVLLTSYGICRIENKLLSAIPFELAIFDEIQLAKNHNTRLYATLLGINAKIRLGLTGTPIENHLRELKALFDIVLPLYMPSEKDYREFFIRPIEKENNKDRKKLLARMIKPFVMRRKKEDVLVDLPDKVEEISHCDLSRQQAGLYNEVLIAGKAKILADLQDEASQVPYIHIFALLSGLKQICDHPAVYLKCPNDYKEYTSGKWDLFVELLNEARESQQKVVVYSQYLSMLDIIEQYLAEMGIGFAGIRGATANRAEQLRRFQHDPSCEVFVASLQAAGLGIDLTAASVVIHYDRWWNAARENQATDRVHRIGQKKGVQVFKLVTKDSFEERIDTLIKKKSKLMDEFIGIDDHEIIKKFTREELIEFLKETHSW